MKPKMTQKGTTPGDPGMPAPEPITISEKIFATKPGETVEIKAGTYQEVRK